MSTSQDVLEFTRLKRMAIVEKLNPDGVNDDLKILAVTLAALDGLDRQELGLRKIDAKEKSTASDRMVAEALSLMLTKGLAGINPFEANGPGNVPEIRVEALPEIRMDTLTLTPGETTVGLSGDNLDAFANRTGMRTDTIAGAGAQSGVSEFDGPSDS